ncbi:Phosphoheptose isomerase 1 [uncultured Rubrobacteraceae bacterium]|uniref:Phosphoheptose isomerase 1 n=1 Tax=uncultured Rubrobacteraceae bacterium TaxID=349277 RepID=A0A6J4NWM4_9ACTN|nr:Phosphoheptose isomerase 1 [uncultured Rubrobacteraceae bacterium]
MDIQTLVAHTSEELLRRNGIFESFFEAEAPRLAEACHEMSRRFLAGGRLLAFGNGSAATDAQHVSVEFVHPVIVGKRALPALDLGPDFERRLPVLLRPEDMVVGFAFPQADDPVERAIEAARERGALTFSLTGEAGEYSFAPPDGDPFVIQEVFEILYHLLWETVHVYFEHREQGHDVGNSSFLYPFLGKGQQPLEAVVEEVQGSMLQKMREVNRLRSAAAGSEATAISRTAAAIAERVERGGKLIAFGNGGSATDANDFVSDCVDPPPGWDALPAVSLAAEPANITAIANDIGKEAIFARQLIAHAGPEDVAVGISTSGGSANILAALAEARRRGLLTVGIVGYDGGRIVGEQLTDHALVVRSDYIPRIQEVQASIYHVLRGLVDRRKV